MSSIGDFLRNKRNEAGYTQDQLAKACGLKYDSAICKIENGTQKVSWEDLGNISKVLGNFHVFEALKSAGYISDDDINPQLKLYHLNELSSEEIEKVQEVIDFFLYRRNRKEG